VATNYSLHIDRAGKDRINSSESDIKDIVDGQGNSGLQELFLWESIRQRIIDSSVYAVGLLESDEVKRLYGVGRESYHLRIMTSVGKQFPEYK